MSFFPQAQQRIISPVGRVSSKIAIVGDYTSPFDDKALLPFSGPAGSVLEQCLHAAGLIKGEVYMTNLFKTKAKGFGNKRQGPAPEFFDESRGTFTAEGSHHVSALRDELDRTDANVIIAAGAAAFAALCGLRRLSMYRGYVFESRGLAKIRKVI